MNSPKFPSGSDYARTLAAGRTLASVPAAASASTASSARTGGTTDSAELKAAFFQQSGLHVHIRKGPIPRMPLRPAKPNRPRVARGANSVGNHDDESNFDIPDDEVPAEQTIRRIPGGFQSRDESEGDNKQDGGDRDERRFKKLFSMAPPAVSPSARGATFAAGTTAARAQGVKNADAIAPAPLPELRSLRDVLNLIQSASSADPSGKSVPLLLRRINAAALQGKVTLPKIERVADVREMLIDVFGKGHQGAAALPATQRSLHAMLPLWLLNLGRQRTLTQQTHAAARLSLPRLRDLNVT